LDAVGYSADTNVVEPGPVSDGCRASLRALLGDTPSQPGQVPLAVEDPPKVVAAGREGAAACTPAPGYLTRTPFSRQHANTPADRPNLTPANVMSTTVDPSIPDTLRHLLAPKLPDCCRDLAQAWLQQ
jgi:hypothetical protein